MEKKCFKCGIMKDISEFYKHPKTADGCLGKCKECTKKDVKERYDKNPEIIKAYEAERFKRPERKKAVIKYQRNRRKNNPLVTKAYNKERTKEFKECNQPMPCLECGIKHAEKHHPDYTNPLRIEWLCRKHHLERHGRKSR